MVMRWVGRDERNRRVRHNEAVPDTIICVCGWMDVWIPWRFTLSLADAVLAFVIPPLLLVVLVQPVHSSVHLEFVLKL